MDSKEKSEHPQKRVFHFAQILPNNNRVQNKLADEKLEEEVKLRIEYEKQRKKDEFDSEEKQRSLQRDREMKQKMQNEQNQREDKKEREKQVEKMEGNLSAILRQLKNNTSPYELNFAGLDLDSWNLTSLMMFLPENQSLLTLNLARKRLSEDQAKEISDMLKKNKKLRRLELEGNEFGPGSAKYFADALKVNKTLRYLDLENNNLTNQGEEPDGIIALFDALKDNTMLVSLNLNNNYLTSSCGQAILTCLKKNKILIHLETFLNQRFEDWRDDPKYPKKDDHNKDTLSKFVSVGLTIQQINDIKDRIAENRTLYDNMRKDEWHERKYMEVEHDDKVNFSNVVSEKQTEQKIVVDDKNIIEDYYMDNFKKQVEEMEKQFQENVNQFFVDTRARLDKKKGKKGGGKKKNTPPI